MRASWRYILFTLLLFYHFHYLYEGSGIVTGNDASIYPQRNAIVERLYVQRGSVVHKEDPLADLESSDVHDQIELLQARKKKIERTYTEAYKRYKQTLPEQSTLFKLLEESLHEADKALQNAKAQFRAHLITRYDLEQAQKRYLQTKLKLENSKMQFKLLKQLKPDRINIDVKIAYLKKSLANYRSCRRHCIRRRCTDPANF